jgi:hypothetical protein
VGGGDAREKSREAAATLWRRVGRQQGEGTEFRV